MHHPRRKPSTPPCVAGRIIPSIVDGFDSDHVGVLHCLNGPLNQPAGNSTTAQLFIDIYGVDNADPSGFDDGGNRFPVVDAADEKTSESPIFFSDIANAGALLETGHQPLRHGSFDIRLELHV